MVRGRDACWEHCVLVDLARQKVRCNYCQREFSGGVYRMKFHLAKIKNKDIVPCTEVPDGISNMISNMLSTASKYKPSKKPKINSAINGAKNSSSATGDFHPNAESSGQNGSTCPSSLLPLPSPNPQPTVDDSQRKKYEDADKKIASFFFHNSIPFDASKSIYYQAMFDAVAECGNGYKAPSFGCLRSTLLEKEKGEMKGRYAKLREEWKETGCTILVNWWTNNQSMTILVFSVVSPKGAFFLKSVEVSFHAEDSYFLFELLDSIVLDVGHENVIQVIVDNMDSCASVGRMLLKKYPSIFWSTCASRCIDTMLEDISKLELFRMVMEDVSTITQYIYSNVWVMDTMRKFTGGRELIRPKITRYFTCFLSLRSLVIHEDNLKHMFSHGDWLSSPYSRTPEAQSIKSLLFLDKFWMSAREAVNVLEPLVKLLRIVDDEAPAVGYIYEGIERAKGAIKMYYRGCEEKYMPIWEIINGSWSMQLNIQLTSAAAFLNPSTFHNPSFKYDSNMRNGFHAAMQKMFPEEIDRIELAKEQPVYINSQGALGNEFAIIARKLNSPGDWWAAYGYEIPVLQRAAVRILSQPCSSNWCKCNWNTFEKLHSLKCNTLEQQKFSDLVFVHFNLRLQAMNSHKESKCKAIVFDEIDVSCEWPSEIEAPSLVLDDSWLDNLD